MARRSLSPGRVLGTAMLLALVLALAPTRATWWVEWFVDPVMFVAAPLSDGAAWVSRQLRPARSRTLPDDPDLAALAVERDRAQLEALRAQQRVAELEELIEQLQGGLALAPELPVRTFEARVVGSFAGTPTGTMVVRAGADRGVIEQESVAAAYGVHLVGRVVQVGATTSRVLPVTSRDAGRVLGVVTVGDSQRFECSLVGAGKGTLEGDLARDAVGVEPGQIVRVRDESWPEAAQMLILGRIELVAEKENAPLRLRVVVRPDLELERVRRVVIRAPDTDANEGSGG